MNISLSTIDLSVKLLEEEAVPMGPCKIACQPDGVSVVVGHADDEQEEDEEDIDDLDDGEDEEDDQDEVLDDDGLDYDWEEVVDDDDEEEEDDDEEDESEDDEE